MIKSREKFARKEANYFINVN